MLGPSPDDPHPMMGFPDPSPVSVPVLMRDLGNKSQRGVS